MNQKWRYMVIECFISVDCHIEGPADERKNIYTGLYYPGYTSKM